MPNVTWISGWGVPPDSLQPVAQRLLPHAAHSFLPPVHSAAESATNSDCVIAWSLGAWHILNCAASGLSFSGRVFLLAPFVAFCSEFQLGGRCSQTQVRWLRRWLQRDPMAALHDFFQRAGLGEAPKYLPYPEIDLLQGLDLLAADASPDLRHFASYGLPGKWVAIMGDSDPLLDAAAVAKTLPGCQIVPGAGHAPEPLLTILRDDFDAI